MMHVAVLTPSFAGSVSCFAAVDDILCTPQHYFTEGNTYLFSHTPVLKATAVQQVARLQADVVVNLCDGAWDEDRAGIEVIHALVQRNIAFAGAHTRCFDQSKPQQKAAALRMGLHTPRALVIQGVDGDDDDDNVQQVLAACTLSYPCIVKHPRGYGSVGLTPASKVHNHAQLCTQVSAALRAWGAALVEEFVVGREATVLVVEQRRRGDAETAECVHSSGSAEHVHVHALCPVECVFMRGGGDVNGSGVHNVVHGEQQEQDGLSYFKDFVTKFGVEEIDGDAADGVDSYEQQVVKANPPITMAWKPMNTSEDAVLVDALCSAACKVFRALGCVGYARADFRIDPVTNTPWFLEINPNCGVFYPPGKDEASADVILRHDAAATPCPPSSSSTSTPPHASHPTTNPTPHNNNTIGGHQGFVHTIITSALYHQAARRVLVRPCHDVHHPHGPHVLQSLVNRVAGEEVLVLGVQPQWITAMDNKVRVLVVALAGTPVSWWPLAHDATNPTCVVQGAALVARRLIRAKHDALSVDYGCPRLVCGGG